MRSEQLHSYLTEAMDALLAQGHFDNGWSFRRTQRQALEIYRDYLESDELTVAERLKGFFEIPTGVGKTALFVAIISKTHEVAKAHGDLLKSAVVLLLKKQMEKLIQL